MGKGIRVPKEHQPTTLRELGSLSPEEWSNGKSRIESSCDKRGLVFDGSGVFHPSILVLHFVRTVVLTRGTTVCGLEWRRGVRSDLGWTKSSGRS